MWYLEQAEQKHTEARQYYERSRACYAEEERLRKQAAETLANQMGLNIGDRISWEGITITIQHFTLSPQNDIMISGVDESNGLLEVWDQSCAPFKVL